MDVITRKSFADFEPWSGAVDTWERIQEAGKIDNLENILEVEYPDGIDETELNDLLWFEPETIYNWLDMPTDEQEAALSVISKWENNDPEYLDWTEDNSGLKRDDLTEVEELAELLDDEENKREYREEMEDEDGEEDEPQTDG